MEQAEATPLADLRRLLVGLWTGMTAAGESVDVVYRRLLRVAGAYGADVEIVVFPTFILLGVRAEGTETSHFGGGVNLDARFDQSAAVYRLLAKAERGEVDPAWAAEELDRIAELPPPLPAWVRILAHGLLTAGLALLLQPTWAGLVVCFLLGVFVGVLKQVRPATLEVLLPVLAAFVVSVIVFTLASHVDALANPLRILIPPLATFLPGAVITTGVAELAVGETVAGSSRLVKGFVQLLLLAFGILAAASVVDVPTAALLDQPVARLGAWSPWVGIVLFAVAVAVYYTAPARSLPFILAVLLAAWLGTEVGARLFSAELSGFFGALAMTPLALWIDGRRGGVPSVITFTPAFWFLVPGVASLIGLTEILGARGDLGQQDFGAAFVTIMSIALGILVAASVYRTAQWGLRSARSRLPR